MKSGVNFYQCLLILKAVVVMHSKQVQKCLEGVNLIISFRRTWLLT